MYYVNSFSIFFAFKDRVSSSKILFYKKFENATELLGVKKIGFRCNYTKLGGMIYTHYAFYEDSLCKMSVIERGMLPQGASTLRNAGFGFFGSLSEIINLNSHTEEE
jgi:hypothetical protein